MKSSHFWCVVIGAAFVSAALPRPANANIAGSTLSWEYYVFGGRYGFPGATGTFIADGSVGGPFIDSTPGPLYFEIVADATSITFDYSPLNSAPNSWTWALSPLSLAPTIHNGLAIDRVTGPAFQSVSINSATNMVGFDQTRFSFTANQIQVDWQNLAFTPDTIVKLDVNIPEPTGLTLSALAAAGALIARRTARRRR